MRFIADLHFHSKYSRAVSPKMELANLAEWGVKKGISLLTTSDFTHPVWLLEIERQLSEVRPGVYQMIGGPKAIYFILTTEVSLIFPEHRIHLIMLAPNIKTVKLINQELNKRNFNLASDGRPILGINAHDFVAMVKNIDPKIGFIPAHIWTPWFSLYGSRSGFNSIQECFKELASEIPAIETGLSSDPLMNWQIEELDQKRIVSFSDAHSLENLGRNATIFDLPKNFEFKDLVSALKTPYAVGLAEQKPHIASTIEFYPEEGKYHYTGHRKCQIHQSPEESKKLGTTCPVCGRPLTIGVMHQVQKLSRKEAVKPRIKNVDGLRIVYHPKDNHHPFISLVMLKEIIAEAEGSGPQSQKVRTKYDLAISQLVSEMEILIKTPIPEITRVLGEKIADGVARNRSGQIVVEPGYDGVYGKVKIWNDQEPEVKKEQMALF